MGISKKTILRKGVKINTENVFERYELLCKDVKHQICFVDDCYAFDFEHLNETLKEMKKLQDIIKQNQINENED